MSYSLTPFYDAIASSGISPPDTIHPDGKIHRFGRKKSSWYVAFSEPVKTIVYGDWKLGLTSKFIDTDKPISDYQKKRINREIQKAARQRQQELEKSQQDAAALCNSIWKNAKPAIGHPYLVRKKVPAYRLRVAGDWLLIPVTDGERIHSLQRINHDGEKRFYPGGKVRGLFYPIGLDEDPKDLYICEGIATGLTIHQLQKISVIVAFNAKNLIPVAELMHWRYPDCAIVIAGDNDHATPGNPGKAAAELAAIRSNSDWTIPNFDGLLANEEHTDFNDLAILRGDL